MLKPMIHLISGHWITSDQVTTLISATAKKCVLAMSQISQSFQPQAEPFQPQKKIQSKT